MRRLPVVICHGSNRLHRALDVFARKRRTINKRIYTGLPPAAWKSARWNCNIAPRFSRVTSSLLVFTTWCDDDISRRDSIDILNIIAYDSFVREREEKVIWEKGSFVTNASLLNWLQAEENKLDLWLRYFFDCSNHLLILSGIKYCLRLQ